MSLHTLFDYPKQEPDERIRDQLTFYNPYTASVLEGGPIFAKNDDIELVAILSSN